MTVERRIEHRKNPKLETLLQKINDTLAPSETQALTQFTVPQHPIILILGCARSGSTLLMQWLANLGCFVYPTNLLSRFYRAPYIGALVQELLTNPELDFHDELHEFHQTGKTFSSALGKTKGVLAPHEFWYFWRRFFAFNEIQRLDDASLRAVDTKTLLAELAAIESVFDKPLAMKGMIVNWNIEFIDHILPKVLFVHIQRAPILNAQSLLESRRSFFGSLDFWYSFKPPEYEILKDLDPYAQVAGQVYFTNKAIANQLDKIDPAHHMTVDYAEFCHAPESLYQQLLDKLAVQGWQPPILSYSGPAAFKTSSELRLTDEEYAQITNAYAGFLGGGSSYLDADSQEDVPL